LARPDIGIQLHLPTYGDRSVGQLRDLAELCAARGATQVWVTDNLESRNLFVVLAALSSVPIRLGAAVMVQYVRNPVEAAAAIATVSELMDQRELVIGLGRGNPDTQRIIEMPRPIAFLREMALVLRALLAGQEADLREYPLLCAYFRFIGEPRFQLAFRAPGHVRIFGGASGPLGLRAARETMDGLIFNGTLFLPLLALGRLDINRSAALATPFGSVANVKVSVHRDRRVARDFVRPSVAARMVSLTLFGFGDDEFRALGIDPEAVRAIVLARSSGAPAGNVTALVTDPMIDAMFIAGDVAHCRQRLLQVSELAQLNGIDQLMFSELGPDPAGAIRLLIDDVVPALATGTGRDHGHAGGGLSALVEGDPGP
jgi:alkanesulfonate monooxygenase SsuD/methylene tetrahydromethanopterin reductase-like flavin-dependent oxidoreductase (luciferase family)